MILFGGALREIVLRSGGLQAHYFLCKTHVSRTPIRKHSQTRDASSTAHFSCYSLPHRTVLNVSGQDTSSFLQGIITNDMNCLGEDSPNAMYAHVLNVQGRTLYDIILYSLKGNPDELNGVLLECDSTVQNSIMQLLKVYKIRRKVNISICPSLSLWALLPQSKEAVLGRPDVSAADKVLVLEKDPRTELMGWRMVTSAQDNPLDIVSACRLGNTEEYHRHRYEIGLPEGVGDLPPGEALPLEANLVYMQGISFSKGCYIGQELTARTHHTGVIRKRLMPVSLSAPAEKLIQGSALQTEAGKPAGKYRTGVDKLGLSLVRLAHAKEALQLKSSDDETVTVQASVPDWWPKAPKEK